MNTIWAPWRMEYIQTEPLSGCVFCRKYSEGRDEENYILHRSELSFVLLNLYPYNNGHLMIAPKRHVGALTELRSEEMSDLMGLVQKGVRVLSAACRPEGFNIGLNLGSVAGAGITDHIHVHVVPRWQGDTNFMPVLAETKVMPQHLKKTFDTLLPGFEADETK